MAQLPESLTRWIAAVIAAAPTDIRLIYLEWNDARRGSRKVISLHAFGYQIADFDPESPSSLMKLSDWQWEYPQSTEVTGVRQWTDTTLNAALLDQLTNNSAVTSRGRQIVFGRHESCLSLFPQLKPQSSESAFYELHVVYASNSVDVKDDTLDNNPALLDRVISYQPIEYPLSENATFHLQPRGKELDLLSSVRWLICSARMRDLIQSSTNQCQVFPIRLYRSKKPCADKLIPNYSVVHLHEKLDCLHPDDILPPPFEGFLPTFNAEKGYRIKRSTVGTRSLFRIGYENQRLLASQSFRDKCDSLGITGVEWLRRDSLP